MGDHAVGALVERGGDDHDHLPVSFRQPRLLLHDGVVIREEGAELIGSTSAEFTAFLKADLDKWTKVIKAAKISPVRM